MQKRLSINNDVFFLVENAKEPQFSDNDIMLSVVVNGESYFLEQEPYEEPVCEEFSVCEIIHMLKHFSNSSNFREATVEDLGYEYFVYQSEFEKSTCEQDVSRDLYEFGHWLAFGMKDIAVLFYKKTNKMYCQITQNDWVKGVYKSLCTKELTQETLDEWKKKLTEASI